MRLFTVTLLSLLIGYSAQAALSFDKNVPGNIKQQFLDDLDLIKTIELSQSTNLHKKIYGAKGGTEYSSFFESHVSAVGMNSCGGGAAVACVIPWFGDKMWLTQNFVKFSHPAIARLMVVFHEARHTESKNGNWGHARCPVPFRDANGNDMKSIWTGAKLEGEDACDGTAYGAYASTVVMLKNVQKFCATCSQKVMMDAGIYADDQYLRVIDSNAQRELSNDVMAP